jgi:hypothetical protein
VTDFGEERQVTQLLARSPGSRQISNADAGLGGHEECVDELGRDGWRSCQGLEQLDAAVGGGSGREGVAGPVLGAGQRVECRALGERVVELVCQLDGPLGERGRLRCCRFRFGFFGEEGVAEGSAVGERDGGLGGRVVAGQLAGSGEQRDGLVGRWQPSVDAGHAEEGCGCCGQVLGSGGGIPGLVCNVRGGLPEVVCVVAAHPARGHLGCAPESSGLGGRVVGERGCLLVAPLGLTGQVA